MFIRLTRTDGLPIWLNASFIVTVEPTRSGGSIVVPIGDGLDYDVREAPESVLALLNEAPPARVVPVPPPKALTHTPEDVSPDVGHKYDEVEGDEKTAQDAEPEAPKPSPKKRTRRTKAAAKKAESTAEAKTQKGGTAEKAVAVETPEPADFDKIVAGLRVHKCRTARRLRNAIKGFFGKTDEAEIDQIVETMINRNYILIGADGHIDWMA